VYIAGDPELLPLARESAALLSLGATSLLSHRTAAAIWGLANPNPKTIDVTVVDVRPRHRPGVRIHRVADLHVADTATTSNLRITSPARSLIEFASQATSSELEHAFGEARAKRLINEPKLNQTLQRAPQNHPGAARIRHLLETDPASTYTRAKAERLLRRTLAAADLPQPTSNVPLLGYTADFLWAEHKLILEVDGYGTHGNRLAFESDRKRDQVHIAAGYTVIRVTWEQLKNEPYAVIARIAQALARRAA
jgi:very-short-patch-repair endonuclease